MLDATTSRPTLLAPQSLPWATPLQLIAIAAEAGFDNVAVKLVSSPRLPLSAEISAPDFAARAGAALRQHDVRAYSATIYYLGEQMDWAAIERSLQLAHALDVKELQVIGDDPDRKRMAGSLARLCLMAEPYDIGCLVENAPYRALGTVAEIETLISEAGQPNAGLCLNLVNFFVSGGTAASLERIDVRLLAQIQIADAEITGATRATPHIRLPRLPLGHGTIPFDAVAAWLPRHVMLSAEFEVQTNAGDLAAAVRSAREARIAMLSLTSVSGMGDRGRGAKPGPTGEKV